MDYAHASFSGPISWCTNLGKTPTMLIVTKLNFKLFTRVMDVAWDSKIYVTNMLSIVCWWRALSYERWTVRNEQLLLRRLGWEKINKHTHHRGFAILIPHIWNSNINTCYMPKTNLLIDCSNPYEHLKQWWKLQNNNVVEIIKVKGF